MTIIHQDHNGVTTTHLEGPEFGAPGHFYNVNIGSEEFPVCFPIDFQHGPVKANGVNGLTNEALLAILIHRTGILDEAFPCEENKAALVHMRTALALFESRTKNRIDRGVEGENKV